MSLTASMRPRSAPASSDSRVRERRVPTVVYWLSGGLAVLLVVASGAGLFVPALYRDPAGSAAQARGTDLVTLAIAVPTVVAALVLSFFSLVAVLPQLDADAVRARFAPGLPVRTIATYLLAVAALFSLAWMKDIVPAIIGNTAPASLDETKLPTNPVHVLDLSLLLPLAILSGVWLWQRRSWGYLLAGILLPKMAILGASMVSATLFQHADDPKVSLGVVPLFAVVTLAGLSLLVVYLRHLQPGQSTRRE